MDMLVVSEGEVHHGSTISRIDYSNDTATALQ